MDSDIAYSAIRISTPLIYAALGGLLTYQAGILNIALDGFMIVSAFAAIAVAYATESLTLGVIAGVISAVVLAALLAVFNLRFRANIFIAGIAVTFMAYGLTALLLKGLLGQEGVFSSDRIPTFAPLRIPVLADVPIIGPPLSGHTLLVYLAYLLVPVVAFFLYRTRWGLRVRVVGEAEDAAEAGGDQHFGDQVPDDGALGIILWSRRRVSLAGICVAVRQADDQRERPHRSRGDFFRQWQSILDGCGCALVRRRDRAVGSAPANDGLAPQLLQLIPYVVTLLALVAVGVRKTRARSRHGAWQFEL